MFLAKKFYFLEFIKLNQLYLSLGKIQCLQNYNSDKGALFFKFIYLKTSIQKLLMSENRLANGNIRKNKLNFS